MSMRSNAPTEAVVRQFPLIDCLKSQLAQLLPGRTAQAEMAPRPRPGWEPGYRPPSPPRQGGVLVLFYPHGDELHVPLILRPSYNGVHSGQVSFPGGGREAADGDITATALREAYEEIGVPPDRVQVLGHLSKLYIGPSNYEVHPTVGWMSRRPAFRTDPYEVARLLEVPLTSLLDPANRRREEWLLHDRRALVPYFAIQQQTIWGATAMMLSELLTLIRRCQSQDG